MMTEKGKNTETTGDDRAEDKREIGRIRRKQTFDSL